MRVEALKRAQDGSACLPDTPGIRGAVAKADGGRRGYTIHVYDIVMLKERTR